MSSSVSFQRINERTRVVPPSLELIEAPWSTERLFRHHFVRLRELYSDAVSGYIVASVFANRTFSGGWIVPVDGHAVVGRHSQADVSLGSDPGAALRHLLVRVRESNEGAIAQLFDLRTEAKLDIDGLGKCEAAITDGDVLIRIGRHSVLLLKVLEGGEPWSWDGEAAWSERPRTEVVEPELPGPRPIEASRRNRTHRPRVGHQQVSRVVRMPGVARSCPVADGEPPPPSAVATMRFLLKDGDEMIFGITAAALRRGVLLGRYPRCEIKVQDLWRNDFVSRVHALIIGDEREVVIVDTASSGGTYVDCNPVRSAVLGRSSLIELSRGNEIMWRLLGDGHHRRPITPEE